MAINGSRSTAITDVTRCLATTFQRFVAFRFVDNSMRWLQTAWKNNACPRPFTRIQRQRTSRQTYRQSSSSSSSNKLSVSKTCFVTLHETVLWRQLYRHGELENALVNFQRVFPPRTSAIADIRGPAVFPPSHPPPRSAARTRCRESKLLLRAATVYELHAYVTEVRLLMMRHAGRRTGE